MGAKNEEKTGKIMRVKIMRKIANLRYEISNLSDSSLRISADLCVSAIALI